ncbi:MAG: adenosylmethionine decarboxylase [Candidatus Kerfeldbacteria bacterium]|nr:adenosylmethionine decarboxylase [Candidatus Kerfeldbacteria bacterium]
MANAKVDQQLRSSSTLARLTTKPKNKPAEILFGTHLTLDGYGASASRLNDMDTVFTALNDLPDLLAMQKITTPYVVRFAGNEKKDPGGYSGFVMIAESHISVHTFPERGFVTIDVYTCQGQLDVKTCISYFTSLFRAQRWERHVIRRGRHYGRQ